MKIRIVYCLVFCMFLFLGCSRSLKMTDEELSIAQNKKTKEIMLEYGTNIIPPKFEKVPLEKDSQYKEKKVEKSLFNKFLEAINIS